MTSPAEAVARARAMLAGAGIAEEEAALDAEVLARHVLSWDRGTLLAHGREPAPPGFEPAFDALVSRRMHREPVAQIVGHREFWGLEFDVTPDVLIPRPETELIVEEAIAFSREHACRTVLDVGTGSGCLAVSVARELPGVRITATDCSTAALAVAERNAVRHNVADRIGFVAGDLLEAVDGPFDMIVSNPPYVPEAEVRSLQPEVVRFEPHAALFAGADGLAVIRRMLHDAPSRLAAGGCLILEFGAGQEDDIRRLASQEGWELHAIRNDLQGIPRSVVLKRLGAGS